MENGILYRKILLHNENVNQLVLPSYFRDMKERLLWPGINQEITEKINQCDRCVKSKTPEKNSTELVKFKVLTIRSDLYRFFIIGKK